MAGGPGHPDLEVPRVLHRGGHRRPTALVGFQTCGRTVTAYARAQSSGRRTDDSTSMDSTGGCGYTVGDELLAYDTYDVTLETSKDDLAKGDESFDGALVVYRPVD